MEEQKEQANIGNKQDATKTKTYDEIQKALDDTYKDLDVIMGDLRACQHLVSLAPFIDQIEIGEAYKLNVDRLEALSNTIQLLIGHLCESLEILVHGIEYRIFGDELYGCD